MKHEIHRNLNKMHSFINNGVHPNSWVNKMSHEEPESLKLYAEDLFLRSKDEVSNDKEILEKLKDKIVIIKETRSVEVIFKNSGPQVKVPLYLIGKLVGHKILKMIDEISADTPELSANLHIPLKGLSRPLGILLSEKLIEKTSKGFQIRAFKIIDFLDSLKEEEGTKGTTLRWKKGTKSTEKSKNTKPTKRKIEEALKSKGINELCQFLNVPEEKVRKILFVRENNIKLIDSKFIKSTSTKEVQLDTSLALLLMYKYVFDLDECPSVLLRKKLRLLGVKSLVNLTTNLHKYTEYIIHDAGKVGSTDNYFLITQPGENRIKEKIKEYLEGKND